MGASIWDGSSTIVSTANADNVYKSQKFTATAGQTLFTLTSFAYQINTSSVEVFINGAAQFGSGVDFTETSNTSITLTEAAEAGDVVFIRGFVGGTNAAAAADSAAQAASSAVTASAAATTASTAATNASASATAAANSAAQAAATLANKADKATTLAGYGITDAYTQAQVNSLLAGKANTATTLAGYGITDAYTKAQVDASLSAKQNSLGFTPVQQGTGVGQGANTVKMGWGSASGGLKVTVDSTDLGYLLSVTTNPNSGSTVQLNGPNALIAGISTDSVGIGYAGTGALSYIRIGNQGAGGGIRHLFDRAAGAYTIGYGNAGSETDRLRLDASGLFNALAGVMIQGGSAVTLGNNGSLQIQASNTYNLVMDGQQIQARNNGAATTLYLNNLGGPTYAGAGFSTGGDINSGQNLVASNLVYAKQSGTWMKHVMQDGATVRGYMGADASNCFIAVNAANTLWTFQVDNSGNATAAANITAYSDERIKTNWRGIPEGFLENFVHTKHGIYDRTDVVLTQMGVSAQDVQKYAPDVVETNPETGLLSVNYGALATIAALKASERVLVLEAKVTKLFAQVQYLLSKELK